MSGEVRGDITARRKITLQKTARVKGNLCTPGIVIEEGARLRGRIVIGSEEESLAKTEPPTPTPPSRSSRPTQDGGGKTKRRAAQGV